MATTTNFGWETPDDTDLVKDGALAIRTLGSAIDTSLVDLKGGTTGQVLSKNSNTDMDFTWVAQDDSNAIQNAIVDAKGDLISATAADTPARLAVGTNGQLLVADSTTATGLKWAIDPTADLVTTAGDILYATAADTLARLGIGTAGQVLKVNSGATAPEWGAASAASFVGCRVYLTANQSINNGTVTAINWDAETFDTDAFHSTTTNNSRITIPSGKAGKYRVNAQLMMTVNDGNKLIAIIKKNGTEISRSQVSPGSAVDTNVIYTDILDLSVNDYLEVFCYHENGVARNVLATIDNGQVSWFSVQNLGA